MEYLCLYIDLTLGAPGTPGQGRKPIAAHRRNGRGRENHTMNEYLHKTDPQIAQLIEREEERQRKVLRMIPSENYASAAVLAACGSCLSNKYSEGYANARYYQGQAIIDQVEELGVARAKALFGAEHANLQPYSGSPANMAVYFALLEPGDRIMGMSLPHGGHLTHGSKVSFSGRFYQAKGYPLDKETGRINYDIVADRVAEFKPKLLFCGASSYPREIDFAKFGEIAHANGAYLVADISHISGLCITGCHPHPLPAADVITSTTHKLLRGPRGGMVLCKKEFAPAIDAAVFPGLQGGPHNQTTAAIAVALHEAATPEYTEYCRRVVANAKALAEGLLNRGFNLVTGGTDNHLVLIDAAAMGFGGKQLATVLEQAGIVANCNKIPFDTRPANDPSGVRMGTPALTSRGMGVDEMSAIAEMIETVKDHIGDDSALAKVAARVEELCSAFGAPGL